MEKTPLSWMKLWAKSLLFPGLDLHTRSRYRFLPGYFRQGPIDTLDAGCGNGALSYAAYKLGNRVLGVTNNPNEIKKARELFSFLRADRSRIAFELCDIHDIKKLGRRFDQIICSETLEHIKDDRAAIRHFYEILRPGGVLHLSAPFALHPSHRQGSHAAFENGGHVRDGYTQESYRSLLEPQGFTVVASASLGTPLLVQLDRPIRLLRNRIGDLAALPVFVITWPLQLFDRLNPDVPFSCYVQAVKQYSA